MSNKKPFRVSVQTALVFEALIIVSSTIVGYLVYPRWEDIWLAPLIVFIYLTICTVPLAVFKGFEYSLHDLDGGFPWAHYHFFAIFLATFLAPFFDESIYTLIGELKLV